jgi:hypothetical protein
MSAIRFMTIAGTSYHAVPDGDGWRVRDEMGCGVGWFARDDDYRLYIGYSHRPGSDEVVGGTVDEIMTSIIEDYREGA